MPFVNYVAYINSEAWQDRRSEFLSTSRAKACCICLAPYRKGFHVHHVTYERLGCERPKDLRLVCPSCHDLVHAVHDEEVAKYLAGGRRKFPTLKSSTGQVRLAAETARGNAKRQAEAVKAKAKRLAAAIKKKAAPVTIIGLFTEEQIEAVRSPKGGFGREGLAKLGVPYPPPKLWKASLLAGKPLSKAMKRRFKGEWPDYTARAGVGACTRTPTQGDYGASFWR